MRVSRFFLPAFGLLFMLTATVGIAQTGVQKKINIDAGWKFHFGNAADPAKDFNYGVANIFYKTGSSRKTAIDPAFNDSSWRNLDLPHDWAVELPFVHVANFDVMSHGYKPVGGLFPETSVGWYRKHFTVSGADSGTRFQIRFDGIFRDARIWLNGFYIGNNLSGYLGVGYDITDYLRYDQDNVLVVRVDATQYEGWFYEGAGIYRHVWLKCMCMRRWKTRERVPGMPGMAGMSGMREMAGGPR
jgi:beta-galactosidase